MTTATVPPGVSDRWSPYPFAYKAAQYRGSHYTDAMLAWARTEKNSRVVYLQLGHDKMAYANPNYRQLLAQAIRWAAFGLAALTIMPLLLSAPTPPPVSHWLRNLSPISAFLHSQEAEYQASAGLYWLALLGFDAKIFPREQDGTTLYRVRLGPYGNLEDVNRIRKTMAENGIDVQLIKVR